MPSEDAHDHPPASPPDEVLQAKTPLVDTIDPGDLLKKHLSTLYAFLIASVGLSSTLHYSFLYDARHPVNFYEVFYIVIYVIASVMLIWLLIWLHRDSKVDVDAVMRKGQDDSNVIRYESEGFNLYLKGGVILFCVISVTYNIVRMIGEVKSGFYECGGIAYMVFCITQAVYIVLLTIFFCMYDKVNIQQPSFPVRVVFSHILVTCICTWFHSGIGEIREGLQQQTISSKNHSELVNCEEEGSFVAIFRPYMLPALIEFALLAAPMTYDLQERMNKPLEPKKMDSEMTNHFPKFHKAKRGLAIGAIVVIISVLLIFALYLIENVNAGAALYVYYSQGLVYSTLALVVASLTYWKIRKLRLQASEGTASDRHILWISFFGSLVFGVLSIVAAGQTLATKNAASSDKIVHGIDLVQSIIAITEMCIQMLVILNSMHRVSRDQSDIENKPGRAHITLLLCLNLSLWIIDTFEVKKGTTIQIVTVGSHSPYLEVTHVLQHIALPMVILFRFHSTICLSVAWSRAFDEDHVRK